jgi:hypothetical protein
MYTNANKNATTCINSVVNFGRKKSIFKPNANLEKEKNARLD